MIFLNVNSSLELVTNSTANIDYSVNWVDMVLATGATPGSSEGKVTTATTTTIVSAPAASTYRQIKSIFLKNVHASDSNNITLQKNISATTYQFYTISLAFGESLTYMDGLGWTGFDKNGKQKVVDPRQVVTGLSKFINKTLTAADATGYWYCASKDAGIPGAWATGSPGMSGRATDGLSANDIGCVNFPDPGSGMSRYLSNFSLSSSAVESFGLMDLLWVNTGIVVTTTTAQTINSVAFPARDDDGTANGKGCMIGLLVTSALGNAAVISNSTVSYTNEDGTASRTATLSAVVGSQIPATAVLGTVVWFQLQSGDEGVKSIQSITLGTTLTSGTVSLIVARPLVHVPIALANQVFENNINGGYGVKLYDRATIFLFHQAGNTSSPVVAGFVVTNER